MCVMHVCGGQRTICRHQFLLCIRWVELRLSGLVGTTCTHQVKFETGFKSVSVDSWSSYLSLPNQNSPSGPCFLSCVWVSTHTNASLTTQHNEKLHGYQHFKMNQNWEKLYWPRNLFQSYIRLESQRLGTNNCYIYKSRSEYGFYESTNF